MGSICFCFRLVRMTRRFWIFKRILIVLLIKIGIATILQYVKIYPRRQESS